MGLERNNKTLERNTIKDGPRGLTKHVQIITNKTKLALKYHLPVNISSVTLVISGTASTDAESHSEKPINPFTQGQIEIWAAEKLIKLEQNRDNLFQNLEIFLQNRSISGQK